MPNRRRDHPRRGTNLDDVSGYRSLRLLGASRIDWRRPMHGINSLRPAICPLADGDLQALSAQRVIRCRSRLKNCCRELPLKSLIDKKARRSASMASARQEVFALKKFWPGRSASCVAKLEPSPRSARDTLRLPLLLQAAGASFQCIAVPPNSAAASASALQMKSLRRDARERRNHREPEGCSQCSLASGGSLALLPREQYSSNGARMREFLRRKELLCGARPKDAIAARHPCTRHDQRRSSLKPILAGLR